MHGVRAKLLLDAHSKNCNSGCQQTLEKVADIKATLSGLNLARLFIKLCLVSGYKMRAGFKGQNSYFSKNVVTFFKHFEHTLSSE